MNQVTFILYIMNGKRNGHNRPISAAITAILNITLSSTTMRRNQSVHDNQNNILPYRSRFLQMPKVEIQELFNDFDGQVLEN